MGYPIHSAEVPASPAQRIVIWHPLPAGACRRWRGPNGSGQDQLWSSAGQKRLWRGCCTSWPSNQRENEWKMNDHHSWPQLPRAGSKGTRSSQVWKKNGPWSTPRGHHKPPPQPSPRAAKTPIRLMSRCVQTDTNASVHTLRHSLHTRGLTAVPKDPFFLWLWLQLTSH